MGSTPRSFLVTGASGLIGRWLVRGLLADGERVVTLERHRSAPREVPEELAAATVVVGDVCDAGLLARTLAEHEVEVVVHLAARSIIGDALAEPERTWRTNVEGTRAVLDAARAHRPDARVLVASSARVYAPGPGPRAEDDPLAPASPYGASKARADELARAAWREHGLPVAVARVANVFGGGDLQASRLVPSLLADVLAGRAPRLRSDGRDAFDFLHVDDAVAAYRAMLAALDAGRGAGEAFNAGAGEARPVRDVVDALLRVAGVPDLEPVYAPERPVEQREASWLVTDKLRALTGWQPEVGLEEGLARTVAWHRRLVA